MSLKLTIVAPGALPGNPARISRSFSRSTSSLDRQSLAFLPRHAGTGWPSGDRHAYFRPLSGCADHGELSPYFSRPFAHVQQAEMTAQNNRLIIRVESHAIIGDAQDHALGFIIEAHQDLRGARMLERGGRAFLG